MINNLKLKVQKIPNIMSKSVSPGEITRLIQQTSIQKLINNKNKQSL